MSCLICIYCCCVPHIKYLILKIYIFVYKVYLQPCVDECKYSFFFLSFFIFLDPPIVTLRLGSTLSSDDIKDGDDVYFECHVQANPQWRKLYWLHDVSIFVLFLNSRVHHKPTFLLYSRVAYNGQYVPALMPALQNTGDLVFCLIYS